MTLSTGFADPAQAEAAFYRTFQELGAFLNTGTATPPCVLTNPLCPHSEGTSSADSGV